MKFVDYHLEYRYKFYNGYAKDNNYKIPLLANMAELFRASILAAVRRGLLKGDKKLIYCCRVREDNRGTLLDPGWYVEDTIKL